jgi:hypothetical protein
MFSASPENSENDMTHDRCDRAYLAYWAGRDGEPCRYPVNSPEWHAWRHGFESEHEPRTPMSPAEGEAAVATLDAA